jgi:hypothetical protein
VRAKGEELNLSRSSFVANPITNRLSSLIIKSNQLISIPTFPLKGEESSITMIRYQSKTMFLQELKQDF